MWKCGSGEEQGERSRVQWHTAKHLVCSKQLLADFCFPFSTNKTAIFSASFFHFFFLFLFLYFFLFIFLPTTKGSIWKKLEKMPAHSGLSVPLFCSSVGNYNQQVCLSMSELVRSRVAVAYVCAKKKNCSKSNKYICRLRGWFFISVRADFFPQFFSFFHDPSHLFRHSAVNWMQWYIHTYIHINIVWRKYISTSRRRPQLEQRQLQRQQ